MATTDKDFAGSIPEVYDRLLVPLIFEHCATDLAARVAKIDVRKILPQTKAASASCKAHCLYDQSISTGANDMCDIIYNDKILDECVHRLEEDLALLKSDLAPLESGKMWIGERLVDGDWADITQAMIAAQKRTIATLEVVLGALHI